NKAGAQQLDFSIMTLDDDPIMTATLQAYFTTSGYTVDVETDPYKGIERLRNKHYDILLLDFLMAPIMGDRVISEIRTFDREIYIILLTGHKSMAPPVRALRELDIQGYYEKNERFDQLELLVESCVKSIKQMRIIKAYRDDLDRKNQQLEKMYASLGDSYVDVIKTLRRVVDARDFYTRGHSDRVSHYAVRIARELNKDDGFCERTRIAGLFHDVGKVAVPDSILLKPGKLNSAEYEIIMTHSEKGYQILSAISAFEDICEIVLEHHERFDGSGYPRGLAGEETREEARIISVADAFDAMTSHRLYRDNLTFEYAVNQLEMGKGSQFDPLAVGAFLNVLKDYDTLQQEVAWTFGDHTEE
ncbi:MAG TPA: HD domain-containing phosphohydrolase, partial [Clostridia bacterium]|nr:HD domain-containing phosphohydrolase [Clostridia bacterium]